MLKNIFRQYDIRGIVGDELNEISVKSIGFELGKIIKSKNLNTISVGYDARTSAKAMFEYLVSGLNKANLEVFDIGMLPTPVGYFSVFNKFFDANIMITGSHNPKNYNGFKITIGEDSFFGQDLQDLGEKVAQNIKSGEKIKDDFRAVKFDVLSPYVDFYVKNFSHLKNSNIKFAIDPANGAAGITLVPIIKALNLNAKSIFTDPDGNFPNHHPDPSESENLKDLRNLMSQNNLSLGFGFDGDADRIAVLSSKRVIKGDELAYLYTKNMKNPRVLGEVKCSQNMYDEINKIGKSFMGKTGHSNIKKAMKELNIDLAAEVSGHIFFKERFFGFDDGVYAMFRVLELAQMGMDLDAELDKLPKLYSTDEIKIKTTEENKFKIISQLKNTLNQNTNLPKILDIIDIDGVRVRFENGWALVRASNTTPVIVTRFEAKNQEFLDELQTKFNALITQIKAKFE